MFFLFSFILGIFISTFPKTINSIPLSVILIAVPAITFCLFIGILYIVPIKDTTEKSKGNIICFIIWSSILIFIMNSFNSAIVDLINGPKEVIIYDARIEVRHGGRTSDSYLLIGNTLTNEGKTIEIRSETVKKIENILEKGNNLKVYYYEKMNVIYNAEIYK